MGFLEGIWEWVLGWHISGKVVAAMAGFAVFIAVAKKIIEAFEVIEKLLSIISRIIRGLHMLGSKLHQQIRLRREDYFWLRQRPNIDLVKKPDRIEETDVPKSEKPATQYSTEFIIKFENKYKRKIEINLARVVMNVEQGRGIDANRASLVFDSAKKNRSQTIEPKKSRKVTIPMKRVKYRSEPETDMIELNKPYGWKIGGIMAKVGPLDFRELKGFEGTQN